MIPEIENQQQKKWYRDAILIKLSVITVLILLLLLPSSWIQGLITEREETQHNMTKDISDKWSGTQLITGPVLIIPYKKQSVETDSTGKSVTHNTIENVYILPEKLDMKANVKTELFHRGLVDATVYNSTISVEGNFAKPDLSKLRLNADVMMYDKARLIFSLSDLAGLKSNPVVKAMGRTFNSEPIFDNKPILNNGLQISLNLNPEDNLSFSYTLDIKGSDSLGFLHIGKTTNVELATDWTNPIYEGNYLPDTHISNANGSKAKWSILSYNRHFPQEWVGNDALLTSEKTIADATFSVKFSVPVDQYHKTMRTTKYSVFIILLTFVSLFLTELIRKQNIHLFNYILIGAAMIVYYTLLLSFAEHVGYDYAYLIASLSTISLISWFTASLFANKHIAVLFATILSTFYGFVYVLIQLEDLSLLIGSVALFIVIALLMYFSRKINWEKH